MAVLRGSLDSPRLAKHCVDIQAGSRSDGARLVIWECHYGWNQFWAYDSKTQQLSNPETGKCITVDEDVSSGKTFAVLGSCSATRSATAFVYDTHDQLRHAASNLCLAVDGTVSVNGAFIVLESCAEVTHQRFYVEQKGSSLNRDRGMPRESSE